VLLRSRFRQVWRDKHDRILPLPKWDKHTFTEPPLPDFYLQNICKFAVKAALVWSPIARRLLYSIQHMLLYNQRLLKRCRMRLSARSLLPSWTPQVNTWNHKTPCTVVMTHR
jgi:hypothetical protein